VTLSSYSKQLNTWGKTLEEIRYGTHFSGESEYTTNFDDILNNTLKVKDWAGIAGRWREIGMVSKSQRYGVELF
jgi:hypothetical protein